ncbi:MAG TPA: hypothetical protein PKW75_12200 [candidate division Zixibacteria bacterium]|nr:hypothetical protein [candidate division Zixibacteria bacterium]HPM38186.1 hypothetical protein [candidate division Zixibacteria bacterium]
MMKQLGFTVVLAGVLLWAGLGLAAAQEPVPPAQAAAPAGITPEAAALMDRMVEATGGLETLAKINNRYSRSTLEIAGMGLSLSIETYSAKPNLQFAVATSEATGSIESGCDGVTAWERSVMTGPRVLEGAEAAERLRDAHFDKYAVWRQIYQSAELAGVDTVNGEVCDVVALTREGSQPEKLSISRDSGLPLKMVMTVEHQMGQIPITVYMTDYRNVDGMKMPFLTTMDVMGQTRAIKVDSVAHNVELKPGLFDLPEDIKALMTKE